MKDLLTSALKAQQNSYSPYSQFAVGAAIRTANRKIFNGCNVENASYGATICSERVAIMKAVSEQGHSKITEVLIVSDSKEPAPPCGLCGQVLAEFCDPDAQIHLANREGVKKSFLFRELVPYPFDPSFLK